MENMSLLCGVKHHLATKAQMKPSILFDSDSDSTISADSCDEEQNTSTDRDGKSAKIYESEFQSGEDLKTNLWPPIFPERFDALRSILDRKNTRNASSICRKINFEIGEGDTESPAEKLPPFATSFKTNFSNNDNFYTYVQVSCATRNELVPELVPVNYLDDELVDFAACRTTSNHLNREEATEFATNENFKRSSVSYVPRSFNKCSKLSTPDPNVGNKTKNLENGSPARRRHQPQKSRKRNLILKGGIETNEGLNTGNRIESDEYDSTRAVVQTLLDDVLQSIYREIDRIQPPPLIDQETSGFEKIPKKHKSKKNNNVCAKEKNGMVSKLDVKTKAPIDSDVCKDSFILSDHKNKKKEENEVQNLRNAQIVEEDAKSKIQELSSEMQEVDTHQNQEHATSNTQKISSDKQGAALCKNHEISASNQLVFSSHENSTVTQKVIMNDNIERNEDNSKTFQSSHLSHQEKVVEITSSSDEKENTLSKNKTEKTEKSSTQMNVSNLGTLCSTIDVKKVVLPGMGYFSILKPIHLIPLNSCKTQAIFSPILKGRIQQVVPNFLQINPHVSLAHSPQISKSIKSDICLIWDPKDNKKTHVFKELNSNIVVTSDKMEQNTVKYSDNSTEKKSTVGLPSDRKEVVWHNCAYCKRKFKTVKGLNNHMEKMHSTSAENSAKTLLGTKQDNNLKIDPKQPNGSEMKSVPLEIKKEIIDEEQNIAEQDNSISQPHINQEFSRSILKKIKKEIIDKEPNNAHDDSSAQARINQDPSATILSEIKMGEEEPNTVQNNSATQPYINKESLLVNEKERLFMCHPCHKVIKNYQRMLDHINNKHAGSLDTVKCIDHIANI